MPLMKCVACKIRLHRAASAADPLGDLCPECGSPLEPVGALADVVGFQSIDHAPHTDQRLAEPVGDLAARRTTTRARAERDADDGERWIDDGGSFAAEAVAMPRPETTA